MKKNFTQGFKRITFAFTLILFALSSQLVAQTCTQPSGLNTTNISNFTVTANWDSLVGIDHYRLRYKLFNDVSWTFKQGLIAGSVINTNLTNLTANSSYIWQLKAYCSVGNTNGSLWSVADTFITTNYPTDCNNTPNGTAYIDSCGNCVGGTTNQSPCIAFSPTISIALASLISNDTTTITFQTSQDPNEPDMSSAVFSSDSGRFNFSGLNINDTIGSSSVVAGGGFVTVNTTLMVDFFINPDKLVVKAVDNISGALYGSFIIENKAGGGILVTSSSPSDNNNVTNGNSQTIILNNMFVNPAPTTINFASTITSDLGDVDNQTTTAIIVDLCIPTTSSTTITACDSYTWNAVTYTTSGTYTDSLINAGGCDSIATLNLTINSSTTSSTTITACDSYSWNGSTYTTGGVYTFATTNTAGCDSTATLNLTINSSTSSSTTITACDSYTWNGSTYTTSGVYTFVTTNAAGCDSTATLNLTINSSTSSSTTITACDSYTWNAVTYTTSGTYTDSLINAGGCDSIATLNLTINNSISVSNNVTICDGSSYIVGNSTYTASGTYTDTLTTTNNCDSIITTNLNVITLSVSITASGTTNFCSGDSVTLSTTATNVTFQWNDDNGIISGAISSSFVATTTGNYSLTITDINGCSATSSAINVTVTTIPIPTNLTSGNISFTSATLSWDNIPSISLYEIRYRVNAGAWLNIVISNNSVNSSALTSNTTYEWEVRAICPNNSNLASAWSATQTFTTLGCTDVTGLNVTNILLDRATLNWNATSTANSYDILFSEVGGSWQYISGIPTNSRLKTGLNTATSYLWKVRSVCSTDTSLVSNWSVVDTFSTPTVCTTPLNTSTTGVGLTTATLNWDAVAGVSEYIIRVKGVSAAWGAWVYDTILTNSYNVSGLNSATAYHWQVRAACNPLGFNSSGFTGASTFTTLTPCTNPAGLTVGNVTAFDASVSWLASMSAIGFEVYYSVQGSGVWDTLTTTSTSVTISGLAFATTYEWGIMSICALGGINNSSVVFGTPFTIDNQCADPTNLIVSGITTDEATLNWDASTLVDHYDLRYRETGATSWTTINNIPGSVSSKTVTGLILSTTYEWELMAICDLFNNISTWIVGSNFTTLSCPVPTNTTTSNILLDRATVNWNAVSGAYNYQIRFKAISSSTWQMVSNFGTSRTIVGLSANTDYHWQVQTFCNASGTNISDWSDTIPFTTPSVCITPINSTASIVGLDFATLTWDSVPGVSEYIIRVKGVSAVWAAWVYDTLTTNSFTSTGLSNSTNYHWQVRAACNPLGFNSSGFTAFNLFSTLIPCGNPTALTVDSVGVNEAYLSWASPVGADHFVVLYSDSGSGVWNSVTTTNTNIVLSALSTYAPHEWKLIVFCDATGLNNSDTITGSNFTTANPCTVPNGLTTTNIGLTSATFNWNAAALAHHYEFRRRAQGTTNWITLLNLSGTSITVNTLSSATTYEWQVRTICTFNGSSFSDWSSTQMVTTLTQCSSTTNQTTSSISLTSATLSWDAVPGAWGYRLRFKETAAAFSAWQYDTLLSPTTSIVKTGLTPGVDYHWQVLTMCESSGINNSSFSALENFTTIALCANPTNLSVSQITLTSAKLNMFGPNNPDHYYVLYKEISAVVWDTIVLSGADISAGAASKIVTGLNPATTYQWKSQTSCQADDSNLSAFVSGPNFTTITPCEVPTNLTSTVNGQDVTFNWNAVAGAVFYTAKYRQLGGNWQTVSNLSTATYSVTNLGYGLSFEWQVSSHCDFMGLNVSTFSASDTFTTASCPLPTNITVTNIQTDRVTVAWTNDPSVNHYAARVREAGTIIWTKDITHIFGSNKTVTGLSDGVTYEFQIRSACTNDTSNVSAWTAMQTFTTLTNCNTKPTFLTTSNITLTSADLSFTGTINAIKYIVRFKESSAAWGAWQIDTLSAPLVSLSKTGLTAGTNYHWQVMAVCDNAGTNVSAWSNYETFTTNQPCSSPTGLSVLQSLMTTSSASLRWFGPMNTPYYVMFKDSTATNWDTLNVTGNTVSNLTSLPFGLSGSASQNGWQHILTLSGLSSATTYNWQVISACASFNISSAVNGANFTTIPPCATPNTLFTSGIAATNATVNWSTTVTANHYALRGRIQGNSGWAINLDNLQGTSRTFFNLTAGQVYEWQVRSVCSNDTSEVSAWSVSQMFTTLVSCNNAPSNATEINIGLTNATLTWDLQASAQKYEVRFRAVTQGWSSLVYTETTQTSMDKTGLTASTHYHWQVRVICDTVNNIRSGWSSWNNFFTDASCGLPNNLQVINSITTLTSATVRWYGPMNTIYYFMFKENAAANWDTLSVLGSSVSNLTPLASGIAANSSTAGSESTITITGLSSATTFNWKVMSVCSSVNTSTVVSGSDFTTLSACATPTNLTSSPLTNKATVSWGATSSAVKYDLRKMEVGGSTWSTLNNLTSTTRTFSGLTPGVTYEWQVRAHCDLTGTNISDWTVSEEFTTQLVCTTPTNPTENNITGITADFSWDAIPNAWGYRIFYLKSGAAWNTKVIDTINTNLYSATGLDPNSTYRWRVHGVCDVSGLNNSGFTSFQYFTTLSSIRITAGDDNLSDNLNIYPNPTRGIFNISFISDELDNFEISVVDAFGKLISKEEKQAFVGEYTKQLDLSQYPRGIYMVQIRTNNSFVSKRVVVQ